MDPLKVVTAAVHQAPPLPKLVVDSVEKPNHVEGVVEAEEPTEASRIKLNTDQNIDREIDTANLSLLALNAKKTRQSTILLFTNGTYYYHLGNHVF